MSGQDGVVGLNHRGGIGRSRVDTEFQLGLFAVVNRQSLHQQGAESRTRAATKGVEDQEALQTGAIVRNTTDFVEHLINHLLSNGVVATGVVVRSILLACDHLFRVEETAVRSSADLVDNVRLEIAVDGSRDISSLA